MHTVRPLMNGNFQYQEDDSGLTTENTINIMSKLRILIYD